MTTSFYNGISGLISFQSGIDIWGDNIANINTPGFKKSIPEFASIFSSSLKQNASLSSDIGSGSYLHSTAKDMSIGSLINTDNPFDIAIKEEGFLAVKYKNNTFYTRNGSFTRDADGYLVNDSGAYLLVANANNLKKTNNGYEIDNNIKTDNLLPTDTLSPISLPDNVILPAVATTEIKLQTNLNDDLKINKTDYASLNSDFSALYNKDKEDMQIRDGNSLIFGFGNNTIYKNNLIESEFCIEDDIIDGKNVNIDFNINGKQIKLTLPDGATKEEISKAISNKLTQNNIQNEITNNGIKIYDPQKIIIQSNDTIIPNTAVEKLVYKNKKENDNEFSTIKEFNEIIQNLANIAYPNLTKIKLEKGKIEILNNSQKKIIHSYILPTENSNEKFLQNLGKVGNNIYPKTASSSFEFLLNSKDFGGEIYDKDGNKDTISFKFTKAKVLTNQTQWNANILIKDKNGKIISSTNQIFTFDSKGNLINPKSIIINSPQKITIKFDITNYRKTDLQTSYSFYQNGIEKGYLQNYEIDENGYIRAIFSNKKDVILAQIPVLHFQNPQGLESIGSSLFKETSNSNKALLYTDNNGNYIPQKIKSNMLETSNVKMNEAMSELIVTQRAFQASAKTVTTSDEMIQKAINLKR